MSISNHPTESCMVCKKHDDSGEECRCSLVASHHPTEHKCQWEYTGMGMKYSGVFYGKHPCFYYEEVIKNGI